MKRITLKAICLFLTIIYVSTYVNKLYAQSPRKSFSLKGRVSDNKTTLPGAGVQLLNGADSAVVKNEITNKDGDFSFEQLLPAEYLIRVTAMGYETYYSAKFSLSEDLAMKPVILKENINQLKEVQITGRKPLIEQHADKMVLSVEGSITASGGTALDVLQKAPGVNVDQNENISMRGKQGVLVMIDGKLVPVSGSELANYLKGISSGTIDKIDLITNPSSKYDASGNAGIIDIKLKKDNRTGTNGSLSLAYGVGVKTKINNGFSLNHKKNNLNFFGTYNYTFRADMNILELHRKFYQLNENYIGGYLQNNDIQLKNNSNNVRAGADYNISKHTNLGLELFGNWANRNRTGISNTTLISPQDMEQGFTYTNSITKNESNNYGLNLNYRQKLDTAGKELSADFDYAKYINNDKQDYKTLYYDMNRNESQSPYLLFGLLNGGLDIKSARINYTNPLKKGFSFEAGLKSSWVSSANDLNFFNRSNGGNDPDLSKSNRFRYKENINALYMNLSGK